MQIEAETIGEAWLKCTKAVIEHGQLYHDGNFSILECLNLSVLINSPSNDDAIIKQYGDNNVIERMINKFNLRIPTDNKSTSYGQRIYSNNGINQIEWLSEILKKKRESKSACISLLFPGDDADHLPCLTTLDAKIRSDKLHLSCFFRSQNILGRQYANLIALVDLQNKIADLCNAEIGQLICFISSAHIYKFDMDMAVSLINGDSARITDQYYLKGPGK